MNERKDKTIKCMDCENEFVFTAGEQEFYETRNFTEPKRCKECRDKRKAQKENTEQHRNAE